MALSGHFVGRTGRLLLAQSRPDHVKPGQRRFVATIISFSVVSTMNMASSRAGSLELANELLSCNTSAGELAAITAGRSHAATHRPRG